MHMSTFKDLSIMSNLFFIGLMFMLSANNGLYRLRLKVKGDLDRVKVKYHSLTT